MKVINSEILTINRENEEKNLSEDGRIMIRLSGTEPFVRIMVESKNQEISSTVAKRLAEIVKKIDEDDAE